MFGPGLGAVLLVSPTQDVIGYTLLAVGIVLGFFVSVHPAFQYPCLGALVYCIHRDFDIPLEVALIAAVPAYAIKWNIHINPSIALNVNIALTVGYICNYLLARPVRPLLDPYTPGVMAAIYVGSSKKNLHCVAIILARHLAPRAVHILYGLPFFVNQDFSLPYYDQVAGRSLALALFAMLAMEPWYHYLVAAATSLCCLVYYI